MQSLLDCTSVGVHSSQGNDQIDHGAETLRNDVGCLQIHALKISQHQNMMAIYNTAVHPLHCFWND